MKTPEQKKIFSETLSTRRDENNDYVPAKQFDHDTEFVAEAQESNNGANAVNIEPVIRPRHGRKWFMSSLMVGFLGLIGWQSVASLWQAYVHDDWLVIGWSTFVLALATIGGVRLMREFFVLRRLKRHFACQEQAENLIEQGNVGNAVSFCQNLSQDDEDPVIQRAVDDWKNAVLPSHNDAEVLELYDAIVLKIQDDKAARIISRYACDSAVLVAMSPLALADMLLVAWRSFKMVDELTLLYRIEMGYWARIRLLKLILMNMALAGASEIAIDTSVDMISTHLTSRISSRVGQGIGVGLLTARLGIQAMKLLRPIPWFPKTKLTLSTIRKQISGSVVQLFSKGEKK